MKSSSRTSQIMVMPDPQVFAGGVDAFRRVEIGGENPQVDVGHEAAEHQQAVGRLDDFGHLGATHRPFVDADEQRVRLRNHALSQKRRGDRYPCRLGEVEKLVLKSESMDLDVRQDHRTLGRGQQARPPRQSLRAARPGRWEADPEGGRCGATCRA